MVRIEFTQGKSTMSDAMKSASNYYDWIFSKIFPLLAPPIVEIGAGFGSLAERINTLFPNECLSVDVDQDLVQGLINSGLKNVILGDITDLDSLNRVVQFAPKTVVCLNVLEHIKDDMLALKNLIHLVKRTKGCLVILVPAHQALFNRMDEEAGHYRRYEKDLLVRQIRAFDGDLVVDASYFNSVGAIGWFAQKFSRNGSLNSKETNSKILFYDRHIVSIAQKLDPVLSRFWGQSLILKVSFEK